MYFSSAGPLMLLWKRLRSFCSSLNMHERHPLRIRMHQHCNFHLSHYHKQWFIAVCVSGRVGGGWLLKDTGIILSLCDRSLSEERYYLCCFNSALYLKTGGGENACQFSYCHLIYFELLLKLASLWGFFHNDLSSAAYMQHTLPSLTGLSVIKSVKRWIYSQQCKINEGKDLIQYHSQFRNFLICSFCSGQPGVCRYLILRYCSGIYRHSSCQGNPRWIDTSNLGSQLFGLGDKGVRVLEPV